jgi:hypothetical protein
MYGSSRKEMPDTHMLNYEVQIAMSELKEIPTDCLPEAFQEAKIEAGAFMPTNGLIVKCYREQRATRRRPVMQTFQALPPVDRTKENFDTDAFFKKIFESLK